MPLSYEAIRSALLQDPAPDELWVIDGGSRDGSVDVIRRYERWLTGWVSEKDRGQSDAINKGLAHATGDVFTWVNSDDALLPNAIETAQRAFASDPGLLVFGGQVTHRDATGERVFDRLNSADEAQLFADPVINQPATYYRLDIVKAIGGVDPKLRYVMDVELWWQVLFRHGIGHLRFEPVPIAMFRLHDESKTVTQHSGFLLEMASVLHSLCERTGNEDVARIIALGYPERRVTRGLPANRSMHYRIARTMAVHFLLKWHGHIHNEAEFSMMRSLHEKNIPGRECPFLPGMEERWIAARERVKGTTWNRFRLRRKFRHLFR